MKSRQEAMRPLRRNVPIEFVEVVGWRRKNRKVVECPIRFGARIICEFSGVHGTWEVWHVAESESQIAGMVRYTRALWMSVIDIRDVGGGVKVGLIRNILEPGLFYMDAAKKLLGQCLCSDPQLSLLY